MNILQIEELNYFDYLALRRDAFIHELNQSESGREYLDKAWLLEQTEPDKKKLRSQFGRKGD